MILTLDFGTSVTKAGLWGPDGPVAIAGAPVATSHPAPGRCEQLPSDWWASLTEACARLQELAPSAMASVEVVGCTGARQSFALADAGGGPLGPAILWSDQRAGAEAAALGRALGDADGAPASGIVPDAGSVAAKIAWLAAHDRDRLEASAWVLAPRDLVAWWLTGAVATDATMASRSGLYDGDDVVVEELAGTAATKLAPVLASDRVTGRVSRRAAGALGLVGGTPLVIGAGDRAAEVLGSGAGADCPMASWGTTANVSLPVAVVPDRLPGGLVVSRAADGGWLLEGGLSAGGTLLAWLGGITGRPPEELAELAAASPPGARGVTATPWLDGARAPWWRPGARTALVGLSPANGVADLSRAMVEAVAWDLLRCLEAMAGREPAGPEVSGLAAAGAGSSVAVWLDVLSGITGLPVLCRRSGQAASAGAALLAARALGIPLELDRIDPVERRLAPQSTSVARYRSDRTWIDRVAASVVGLEPPPEAEPADPAAPGEPRAPAPGGESPCD